MQTADHMQLAIEVKKCHCGNAKPVLWFRPIAAFLNDRFAPPIGTIGESDLILHESNRILATCAGDIGNSLYARISN